MALSLKNKIAFITGCSSGIGQACAEQLAAQGVRLIISARRLDRLEKLALEIRQKFSVDVLPIQLDVRDREQVAAAIEQLPKNWQNIDILINNAGLALSTDKMQDANIDNWEVMIDTNIRGLLYVTRLILPKMVERNLGHIVNLGSIAGRESYPMGNVYCATKHAVKAISQSLRMDLLGTNIRVTEIAPGLVETEFSEVRWNDKKRAAEFYQGLEPLVADDVADGILYCLTRPAHVNISEFSIFPTAQASASHVYRK